ncbi:hypothetical protein [Metabacillus bambusae]|uniref:Uncharacterized protein n=1 Tax=Metabacillus bambusae TaxID=2795218 RepID=A0ABS3NBC4_9BACI|nr:hypothetical protein [Metabacillus bambusae]MBO1515580.1 hypothetical protein [Metabacillus bambusae]
MNVTAAQIENMKHALGLPRSKKPYRNRFYTESDDKSWNDLVEKGLAGKRSGWEEDMSYFYVTEKGLDFLGVEAPE